MTTPSRIRASSCEHILPALRDYARDLHARGKYLFTHTDGENRRLLPALRRSRFRRGGFECARIP